MPDAAQPKMCSKFSPLNVPFAPSKVSIVNASVAARLLRARMATFQEELWVIALSPMKRIVGMELVFRGTADACLVHPRDIVRFLCLSGATSFLLAHNHPSGDLEPSEQDWAFTGKISGLANLMEIQLLDHVVVTKRGHRSMASMRPHLFSACFPGRKNPAAVDRDPAELRLR